MKDKLLRLTTRIAKHELVSESTFLFLGTTLANIFAFALSVFLPRHLSPANYADIAVILTLITWVSMPSQAFIPTIVQFATRYFAKKQNEYAAELFRQSNLKVGIIAIAFLIGFIIFSPLIGTFLHIQKTFEIILAGAVIAGIYMTTTNIAFLQSLLEFKFLSLTTSLGGIIKLSIGVIAVLVGLGLGGVLVGYFLSFLIPFLLTFIPLRYLFVRQQKTVIHNKEILSYGLPAAITVFSLFSFTSTDTLLVKHFLSSTDAALYSGLSVLGRIIFYFSAPIGSVMFPLVIKRIHEKKNEQGLLYASFLLVLVPSLLLVLGYFLFANTIISFVLGKQYLSGAFLLGWFGLYLCVFSLLNILINFLLSIKKTAVSYIVLGGACTQAVGITIFHATIGQVVVFSLILSLVLFVTLLLYYQKTYGSKQNTTR